MLSTLSFRPQSPIRDKEALTTERAVEKQRMEESLVENKMNIILDSGLFSKVVGSWSKWFFAIDSSSWFGPILYKAHCWYQKGAFERNFMCFFFRSKSCCLTKRSQGEVKSPCRLAIKIICQYWYEYYHFSGGHLHFLLEQHGNISEWRVRAVGKIMIMKPNHHCQKLS